MGLITIPSVMAESLLDLVIVSMLSNKNSITTLDVKNEFRATHPNILMNQSTVSNYLADNYENYNLTFSDNGTYRTYSKLPKVPYYKSETKGLIKICDMQYNHLENALIKEMSIEFDINKYKAKEIIDSLFQPNTLIFNLFKEYACRNENK